MKHLAQKITIFAFAVFLSSVFMVSGAVWAEGEEDTTQSELEKAATSISISPVSKILQLDANSVYEDSFKVTNNGSEQMDFEVYASPYSYTVSENDSEYKLGFSHENSYTQITRWVTFKDLNGNYVDNPRFKAEPGESVEISYRISTPSSIPAGGQYAVLFAHTLSGTGNIGGIKTEASPGLVVFGRSSGDMITSGEISNLVINRTTKSGDKVKNTISATAKIKNTGNVDFMGTGRLTVEGILGQSYYETPATEGRISIIPESELTVSDEWEETPYFGLFKVTWSVSGAGKTETISQIILILPAPIIVAMVLLLTIIIIWIIVMVRKRKERRSRFMV